MTDIEQHERFMRIAIRLSEQNVNKALGGPFGAVIVKNGNIIARSANKVSLCKDPTAHAEISAIRLACKKLDSFDLAGCIIYTSCEPCPMCLSAIYWSHIDTVFYANTKQDATDIGFDDQFIYNEIVLPLEKRKLSIQQLLHNEALPAFRLWDKSEIKINY